MLNAIKMLDDSEYGVLYEETQKGHGRIETRKIQTSEALNEYLNFPYVKQVFKITRSRIAAKTGKIKSIEIAYGISSLSTEEANAKKILRLNRGHWEIENRVHWVRDVIFDEDRSQIRTGNGPQVMATLRNTIMSMLRKEGIKNVSQALKWNILNPSEILKMVGR
jgi:predicted transposase YbfD/YdcC